MIHYYIMGKEAMAMEIGRAREAHIPGMIKLLRQVGEVHHQIRPDIFRAGAQKYKEEDLKELLTDRKRPIFVAEEDGCLLGYCFCILEETSCNPVLLDERTLYIDDLCVDENCRGMHVGTALYEYAVKYARDLGCNTITLNVWNGNDSAMAFYEKRGLKPRKVYMEMSLEEREC